MHAGIPCVLALALTSLGLASHAETTPALSVAGRVLLVPPNVGVSAAPEVESGIEPVWQALLHYFEEHEARPASLARESAAALWKATMADPAARDADGERDVYAAYAQFARRVAEQVEYEAIVIPSLVPRVARVHGWRASWDGVHRLVETPGASIGTDVGSADTWLTVSGIRGGLGAASLHVAVLGPDGELRFEGAGGLALLQRPALTPAEGGNALRLEDEDGAFDDPVALREGIEAAFSRPLPASRAH